MNFWDILILLILVVTVILSCRGRKKTPNCHGRCSSCGGSCPYKKEDKSGMRY